MNGKKVLIENVIPPQTCIHTSNGIKYQITTCTDLIIYTDGGTWYTRRYVTIPV